MLTYSSTLTYDDLSALMQRVTPIQCDDLPNDPDYKSACCWTERDDGTGGGTAGDEQIVCCYMPRSGPPEPECKEAPFQKGRGLPLSSDLPQLETIPPNRTLPGGGVGDIPTLEQVPGDTLPAVCSVEAGLKKDPETGLCVPIEPGDGTPTFEQVPSGTLPGGSNIPTLETGARY